jgi:hypothetical protein
LPIFASAVGASWLLMLHFLIHGTRIEHGQHSVRGLPHEQRPLRSPALATRERRFFSPGAPRGCDERTGCLGEAGSVSDDHAAERLSKSRSRRNGLGYRPDVVNSWGDRRYGLAKRRTFLRAERLGGYRNRPNPDTLVIAIGW